MNKEFIDIFLEELFGLSSVWEDKFVIDMILKTFFIITILYRIVLLKW